MNMIAFSRKASITLNDSGGPAFVWILTLGFAVSAHRTKEGARRELARYLGDLEHPEFSEEQFVKCDAVYSKMMDCLAHSQPHISVQRVRLAE